MGDFHRSLIVSICLFLFAVAIMSAIDALEANYPAISVSIVVVGILVAGVGVGLLIADKRP